MANNTGVGMGTVVGAAVVGAAVGAAAAALSNKDNRDAVVDKFEEVKGKVEDAISDAGDKVNAAKKDVAKKLAE
jgi:hypothetical protein